MQKLLLLISPPASGKTFWIHSYATTYEESRLLVISPLRALADECKQQWSGKIKVMTPEEWLYFQEPAEVVIFDEFHLNFYWGDSFRHRLWEAFEALAAEAKLTILLTATAGPEFMEEVSRFRCHFDELVVVDYGNRRLKTPPVRYVRGPRKSWIASLIEAGPRGDGVNLIFCAFRDEVHWWEARLRARGFTVWGCVGGEAAKLRTQVLSGEVPDYIVATSVLSHGVNLPRISTVFFLYPLKNIDFWVQMVARGGRRGEAYEVFSLEDPHGITWSRSRNLLRVLWLSLHITWTQFKRDLAQWFLKASS